MTTPHEAVREKETRATQTEEKPHDVMENTDDKRF